MSIYNGAIEYRGPRTFIMVFIYYSGQSIYNGVIYYSGQRSFMVVLLIIEVKGHF